jgi:hypothetical protein
VNRIVHVQSAPTQEVEALATGAAVANLGPALLTPDFLESAALPSDLDALLSMSNDEVAALPVPDVVELFALAIGEGLFGSSGQQPASARSSTRYDSRTVTRAWLLEIENTPPRALRVLLGLLDGLDAEAVALRTVHAPDAAPFDVESSGWPDAPASCPFAVEADPPDALSYAGRLRVRVEFGRAAMDAERATIERGFEIWTNLLLLGGYLERPLHGEPPVGVEPGGWDDDRTWVQEFEVFQCVPEAVHAILHFLARQAAALPVRTVEIRL